MKNTDYQLHQQCRCEIRYRLFSGRPAATPGLFCREHDHFLEWLTDSAARLLRDRGVPVMPWRSGRQRRTRRKRTAFEKKLRSQRANKYRKAANA